MPTSAALFAVFTATQLLAQIFTPGAKLEKIYEGGHLTEGVTVAPDGTAFFSDITFTSETGMQAGHILRYDPATKRTVVYRSPSGMCNGLKFDAQGHLFVAVRNEKRFGISVYSPTGEELAYLPTPERPTNVAFGRGPSATTLYITAGGSVYRTTTLKPGYQLPSRP